MSLFSLKSFTTTIAQPAPVYMRMIFLLYFLLLLCLFNLFVVDSMPFVTLF